jgi:hypothetical protein
LPNLQNADQKIGLKGENYDKLPVT